jgi:hypothetical protein
MLKRALLVFAVAFSGILPASTAEACIFRCRKCCPAPVASSQKRYRSQSSSEQQIRILTGQVIDLQERVRILENR